MSVHSRGPPHHCHGNRPQGPPRHHGNHQWGPHITSREPPTGSPMSLSREPPRSGSWARPREPWGGARHVLVPMESLLFSSLKSASRGCGPAAPQGAGKRGERVCPRARPVLSCPGPGSPPSLLLRNRAGVLSFLRPALPVRVRAGLQSAWPELARHRVPAGRRFPAEETPSRGGRCPSLP